MAGNYVQQIVMQNIANRQLARAVRPMDKDSREERAYNSRFGRAMRRKNSQSKESLQGQWTKTYETSKTKLSFLLMIYMFTQDDGEIDKKEQKAIDKMIKDNIDKLDKEATDQVLNFAKDNPNSTYVLDYLSSNNVEEKLLNEAVTLISKFFKKNDEYRVLIRDIKNQLF